MVKKKRVCSWLLSVVMFLQLIAPGVFIGNSVQAEAASSYLVNDNFNSLVTGSTPSNYSVNVTGTSSVLVTESTTTEKYLKITDTSIQNTQGFFKSFTPQSATTTFEFDVKSFSESTPANAGILLYILDGSNHQAISLIYNKTQITANRGGLDTGIASSSTTPVTGLTQDTWFRVKIIANPGVHTFDLYINGVLKQAGILFRDDRVNSLNTLQVAGSYYSDATSYSRVAGFDNLKIYAGTNGYIYDENFDNSIPGTLPLGWTSTSFPNSGGAVVTKYAGTAPDYSFKIYSNTPSPAPAGSPTPAPGTASLTKMITPQTGTFTAEWDYLADSTSTKNIYMKFDATGSANGYPIGINCAKTSLSNVGNVCSKSGLTAGTWNHVKVYVDVPNNLYDMYYGDTKVNATPMPFIKTYTSGTPKFPNIDKIQITNDSNTSLGLSYVDNLVVYSGSPVAATPTSSPVPGYVAYDDFYNTTGIQVPGWTNVDGLAAPPTIEAKPNGAPNDTCMKLISYPGASTHVAQSKKIFADQTGVFSTEIDYYVDETTVKNPWLKIYDGTTFPYAIGVQLKKNNISTWDGISIETGLSTNTWYRLKIVVNIPNQTYDVYVNGTLKKAAIAFRPQSGSNPALTKLNNVLLTHDTGGASDNTLGLAYFDNLQVYQSDTNPVTPSPSPIPSATPTPGPVALVDENFDNIAVGELPSGWTPITTGMPVQVEYKEGSTTDKVLGFRATSAQTGAVTAYKSFTRQTTDLMTFEMDYQFPVKNTRSLGLYFYGNKSNDITVGFDYKHVYIVRTIKGVANHITLKDNINSSAWQHVRLFLDIRENTMQIWVNGEYLGIQDFRYSPEVQYLEKFSIGAMSGTSNDNMFVDNIICTSIPRPATVEKNYSLLNSQTFANLADGQSPTDWAYTAAAGRSAGAELKSGSTTDRVYALKSTATDGFNVMSNIDSQGTRFTTGIYTFEFDYSTTQNNSRFLQFYMHGDKVNAISIGLSATRVFNIYSSTSDDTISTTNGVGAGWHKATVTVNMDYKKIFVALDGVDSGRSYDFRDSSITYLDKVSFNLSSDSTGAEYTALVDNYTANQDLTNYGRLNLIAPSPASIDYITNIVYNPPYGTAANTFKSTLSVGTPNAVITITDSKNLSKTTEGITAGDKIMITLPSTPNMRVYTIPAMVDVIIQSVLIGGEEFNSSSTITRSGKADVKVRLLNNMSTTIQPLFITTVNDQKLLSIYSNQSSIATGATREYSFSVNIPENTTTGEFKILVWDGLSSMKPYVVPAVKDIVTYRELTLPNVFASGMVLQRDSAIKVFGEAPSGATVNVSFSGQEKSTTAQDGRWIATLDPVPASSVGQSLSVTASYAPMSYSKTITYDNVLVGDVYFGSGQSNMQFSLSTITTTPTNIPANLKVFKVANIDDPAKRYVNPKSVSENWVSIDSSNAKNYSAVMYYMAKTLRENATDVPIGIIVSAWGGTSVESWLNTESFINNSELSDVKTKFLDGYTFTYNLHTADLYNAMTASVIPYTIRAAVWYQGESNVGTNYEKPLKALVENYRTKWGSTVPFFIVQLPGYESPNWGAFRLRQWNVGVTTPSVYVVVTNDTGDASNIHPLDKDIVGARLAYTAMNKLYNMQTPYSGPVYVSNQVEGSSIRLSFNFVNDGLHGALGSLAADGTSLPGFEIAGADGVYQTATATISGNTVVVTSASVLSPVNVRFGYQNAPLKSLCNENSDIKLPAAPFRTDGSY